MVEFFFISGVVLSPLGTAAAFPVNNFSNFREKVLFIFIVFTNPDASEFEEMTLSFFVAN
jgi:hypothetical protein